MLHQEIDREMARKVVVRFIASPEKITAADTRELLDSGGPQKAMSTEELSPATTKMILAMAVANPFLIVMDGLQII